MTDLTFYNTFQNSTLNATACGKYANLKRDIAAGTAPPGTAAVGQYVSALPRLVRPRRSLPRAAPPPVVTAFMLPPSLLSSVVSPTLAARLAPHQSYHSSGEDALMYAIATFGPVVTMAALSLDDSVSYAGGVVTAPCDPSKQYTGHTMTVVGYGTQVNPDGTKTPFWKVSSSRSARWWQPQPQERVARSPPAGGRREAGALPPPSQGRGSVLLLAVARARLLVV